MVEVLGGSVVLGAGVVVVELLGDSVVVVVVVVVAGVVVVVSGLTVVEVVDEELVVEVVGVVVSLFGARVVVVSVTGGTTVVGSVTGGATVVVTLESSLASNIVGTFVVFASLLLLTSIAAQFADTKSPANKQIKKILDDFIFFFFRFFSWAYKIHDKSMVFYI